MRRKPKIAFVWDKFGPYHMDRCGAVSSELGEVADVLACQIASGSEVYAWAPQTSSDSFELLTLFPGVNIEQTNWLSRFRRLRVALHGSDWAFLAGYQRLDIFLLAHYLRMTGTKVFVMYASKFEDLPRHLYRELGKMIMFRPYSGALVGGDLQRSYLRFLGFRKRPIVFGYNSVNMDRVRNGAGRAAPDGIAFQDRPFVVVSRFVQKKNLHALVAAYARYRELAGDNARRLVAIGSGALELDLHRQAVSLGVNDMIKWTGFLQAPELAQELACGLAILLPSEEEQWGLVINEAQAFNLPAVISDRVGARSTLVRQWVNGFIVEPNNIEGWARAMLSLSSDEALWLRFVENTRKYRALGDTRRFASGVGSLTGLVPVVGS